MQEEQSLIQEALQRQEASKSFAQYSRYVGEVEPAKHHLIICNAIERVLRGKSKRLIICAPPGSAKSTYTSKFMPPFAYGWYPKLKIIGCSHTQELATDFSRNVRDTIRGNPKYHNVFPGTQIDPYNQASERWGLVTGGSYLSAGAGIGIAGYRADIILIDDPYRTRADAQSETIRKSIVSWFYNDVYPRKYPHGAIILIQTRWHPEDLAGVLIQKAKEGIGEPYEVINIQAIYEDPEIKDPLDRQLGEAYWPGWQPLSDLEQIKANMEPLDWLSLYQQKPMNPQGNVVNKDWFRTYDVLTEDILKYSLVVVSWDTAGTTTEKAKYTVGLVAIITPGGDIYIKDMYRKKAEYPQLEKEVYSFCRQHNSNVCLIEDRGTGTSLIQKYKNMPLNVIKISPANLGDKEFRFDQASPTIEAGKVFLPKYAPWVNTFLSEILEFPFGTYKDICDALSQLINWYDARKVRRGAAKMGSY